MITPVSSAHPIDARQVAQPPAEAKPDPHRPGSASSQERCVVARSGHIEERRPGRQRVDANLHAAVLPMVSDSRHPRRHLRKRLNAGRLGSAGINILQLSLKPMLRAADLVLSMISPVSSSYAAYAGQASQPAVRQPQPQQTTSLPQDTVSLKSTTDVDHDGDSK